MFFINPFILSPAGGDFESIATVTVGSGGAAEIEFTSIPATYQHLQIRMIARTEFATTVSYALLRFNGDSASNYAYHNLNGNGSSAAAQGGASTSEGYIEKFTADSTTANIFGAAVVDILDYASTSKNKTVRSLGGFDANGSGQIYLYSNLWQSVSAVTSIKLIGSNGDWAQHTTAALYGIKAP